MYKTIRTFALTLIMGLASSVTAHATIIDNGSYTTDTTSGLDWLDVTNSVNLSYNDVSSQFDAGELFEGWRYATGDEFNALVSNYTGVPISAGSYFLHIQEPDLIDGLITLLGSTFTDTSRGQYLSLGLIADIDPINPTSHSAAMLQDNDPPPPNPDARDFSCAHCSVINNSGQSVFSGSFLVRNSVPEPSVLALLAIGLLGIGISQKRSFKLKTELLSVH